MFRKLLIAMLFTGSMLFAINLNTASKEELMSSKGIGAKKAEYIIKYRKTHKIKSAEDLKNIKGIGDNIVNNVKKGIKNKSPKKASKKTKKSKTSTKSKTKKASSKTKESVKKRAKKHSSKKESKSKSSKEKVKH